ncbi:hypothetical protein D3C78_1241250 [compost metagenome]
MAACAAGRPYQRAGPGVHDVYRVAHAVGRVDAVAIVQLVLLRVIAASEDQHIGNGAADLDLGLDRSRPGLPELLEVTAAAIDLPEQFRAVAVGEVQSVDIPAAPTHGGIGVDELPGVQGRGVPGSWIAIDHPVAVRIVDPERHGIVHAVAAWNLRGGLDVLPEQLDVGQQGLGHEGELLYAVGRIDHMHETFIGAHYRELVGIVLATGGQALAVAVVALAAIGE